MTENGPDIVIEPVQRNGYNFCVTRHMISTYYRTLWGARRAAARIRQQQGGQIIEKHLPEQRNPG